MTSCSTPAQAADHRVRPMRTNWCTAAQPADEDEVADLDVAAQRRVVGHDHAVADLAVVGDVDADHEQPVVADPGDAAAAGGAGVHVACSRMSCCAPITSRVSSPRTCRSCGRWPRQAKGTRGSPRRAWCGRRPRRGDSSRTPASSLTSGPTMQYGPIDDVRGELGAADRRSPSDGWPRSPAYRSTIMRADDWPPPRACRRPSPGRELPHAELLCCLTTSIRSWSPGRTGRRKRALSIVMK